MSTPGDQTQDPLERLTEIGEELRAYFESLAAQRGDTCAVCLTKVDGALEQIDAAKREVTELLEQIEERAALAEERRVRAETEAHIDPATGLRMKSHLLPKLEKALTGLKTGKLNRASDTEEAGHGFTVFYLDLDGLKTLNERFPGDRAGDQAIATFADFLMRQSRDHDVVIREGNRGDEFIIMAEGNVGDLIQDRLKRAMLDLSFRYKDYDGDIPICASIGHVEVNTYNVDNFPDVGAIIESAKEREHEDKRRSREMGGPRRGDSLETYIKKCHALRQALCQEGEDISSLPEPSPGPV